MEMNEKSLKGIHESLHALAFPVSQLELLPGNPRRGDVQAVINSYRTFGQRKPIVARMNPDGKKATVIAGNTQLKAATAEGWSHIAVTMVEDDDKTAAAFAIADNRTHDLGEYDDAALTAMINDFKFDDELLTASGYDVMEVVIMESRYQEEIAEKAKEAIHQTPQPQPIQSPSPAKPQEPTGPLTPRQKQQMPTTLQSVIIFSEESQQAAWFSFVRHLKQKFPDAETLGERIELFVDDYEQQS